MTISVGFFLFWTPLGSSLVYNNGQGNGPNSNDQSKQIMDDSPENIRSWLVHRSWWTLVTPVTTDDVHTQRDSYKCIRNINNRVCANSLDTTIFNHKYQNNIITSAVDNTNTNPSITSWLTTVRAFFLRQVKVTTYKHVFLSALSLAELVQSPRSSRSQISDLGSQPLLFSSW